MLIYLHYFINYIIFSFFILMSIQVQPIGLDGSGKTSLINHMVRGDANRHD